MQVKVIKKIDGKLDRRTGKVITDRLRVCAYCRVSTGDEEQINSYESQKKYYDEKINSNSLWVFAGIYADEAITGTLDYKRNEFMRMITDAMEGNFDVIITKSISRFARNTLDTLKYVRKLKERKIAVIFEKENINTLEMSGEFLLTILSSIAQQESESISGNVKLGLKMKKERGEIVGFKHCLGYDYDKDSHEIKIQQDEAEIVRQIFNRYCEGAGSTIIARELTEAGFIPPKGGEKWAESTIRGIIKNEKYKGDVLQGKTFTIDPITHKRMVNKGEEDKYYIENNHEAIVSAETYEKAQKILEKRSGAVETGRRKGNYSRKYTFSSRIFCGFCGSVFVRRNLYKNTKHETKVWQCMNYVKNGKKFCPETKAIREKVIEDCFIEAYELLCQDNKEVINNFLNRIDGFLRENNTKSILQKLEVKKQGIENKINSLINLMIDGTIDKETFNKKKIELNKKIKKIEKDQELFKCQLDDENSFDFGVEKIRKVFDKEAKDIRVFDKDIFEALIYKVVIGDYDSNGNKDPYVIRFIVKSGIENVKDKIESKVIENILNKENLILDFYSWQNYVSFEKQADGSLRKKLETKIRVKVELNSDNTTQ